MNNDILTALKNAIEHGENLEKAARSFINAGYNASDVREAASYFTSGSSMMVSKPFSSASFSQEEVQQNDIQPSTPSDSPLPFFEPKNQNLSVSQSQAIQNKGRGIGKGIGIALISTLVILLGILIITIIFSDQILNTLFK
ncbi:MAG: hypothetical protein AABW80_04415 [Nanoarchaeota archaeon]